MQTPEATRPTPSQEEAEAGRAARLIDTYGRRSDLRSATFRYPSAEAGSAARGQFEAAGARTRFGAFGKDETRVTIECAPALVEEIVRVALAAGGSFESREVHWDIKEKNPLALDGNYEPPPAFKERVAHIETLRAELASMKFTIDYAFSRDGKWVLTIGGLTLTLDASQAKDSDELGAIDELDRFVLLTRRLVAALS